MNTIATRIYYCSHWNLI